MATRHQVRQAVITLLYTHEMDTFNEDFASEYFAEQKIKNEQKNFAETLFGGVLENIDNIDEKINSYLSSFKLAELGAMERAILRLGAHEILAQTCEARVAISEAVALASEFGSTNGVKLVNGVLDNIAKDKNPVASAAVDTKEFYENLSAIQESLKPKEPRNSRIPKDKEKKEPRNSRISKENKNSNEPRNSRIPKESGFKKSAKSGPASKTAAKQPPKRARKDEK
ncbi:MAG: transcription antitermination factor NusB [Campylobacteraceae bacterium]|nr:transcription antitermination factor NusB [Campylobacteraceae bacterium]MDD7090144.1 transcription antitermination factor NusB [Campylobacteraceae bacterium]